MGRTLGALLVAVILAATPAHAQKKCVKGIPCGNTCIAANKTCRVGTPAPRPTPPARVPSAPAAKPASDSPPSVTDTTQAKAQWVASSRGHVYYRIGCSGARKLSPANLIYFKTEEEAAKAGYRHSTARGC